MTEKNNYFTLYEICLMAFMSVTGMFIKPVVSPVFNLLTDFIRIPGGSVTAGFSMLFLVFTAALIRKKGTATMMGAIQAVIALGLGISSVVGLLVFITYTLPGIAIDAIMCTDFLCKIQMKTRMMLAGGAGVLTGAAFTNMLYFNLSVIPFILFYIFGILSGALGGYMAFIIMERLPESIRSRGKQT